MVGTSLLIQLAVVWMNTHRGPVGEMLKEMLVVISGTAPGIHAMRVAQGIEPNKHAAIDRHMELTYSRCCEMAFVRLTELGRGKHTELTRHNSTRSHTQEAIPGSILQTYALLDSLGEESISGKGAVTSMTSIVISALTTGL
jgi:hypothetical protein